MTSKELSQDSKADKSQQLKKETKDQQKDAQRQRGNLLRLRRKVLYRFQGSRKRKLNSFKAILEAKAKEMQRSCLHLDNCTENDSK